MAPSLPCARPRPSASRGCLARTSRFCQDPQGARLASYRALLGMSRMLLGSASLDELLDRITDELKRLVPYDVLTVYRGRSRAQPAGAPALRRPVRRRDPRLAAAAGQGPDRVGGGAAPRPERAGGPPRSAHRAGARHRERAGDDRGRAADGARPADRRAQRLPPGRGGRLQRRRVRADLPLRRPGGAGAGQHPDPRAADAGGADRLADGALQPPRLPGAGARRAGAGAPLQAADGAGHVRPR